MLKSLFHWKVLLNLVLAMAVFVGLVWLTFRWLEFHTHHGDEIPVPNVMNMKVHDAIKILDDSGLEYEVDSFKYDPKFRPFQVLAVFPAPGSSVKSGRSIVLKVNPRTWAKVAVPDIIDRYKGLAFNQLNLVGLKVGDTLYEPSIQRDAVLRILYNGSSIKPGTLLPKFSSVDLVIGSGPLRNVSVPNLVGRTVQEAKQIVAQALFEVGIVDYEDGGRDDSDIVYYQDPEAGALRDQGMQIDLWASKKTPAEMQNKIQELDEIYRPKIDTTLAPIQYNEVPLPPVDQIPETPKPTLANPAGATATQPSAAKAKTSAPATTAGNSTAKPKTTAAPSAKPMDKPKAKKVVVE
ncbi:PASTA domain-containing protein [Chryseobacterium sp. SC28]|uniref:PASTA domain-containing protein n=1 Tax=Chryseobacterium sp. SC28 TaxID=2268028 RepID=UPI000F64F798|nr:PASTA domain-containing protein [Chryseobacterium sp. SC28]RRQ46805.1 PASTA domain-containing protein [Chryseobacterium sp. SC28]